MSRAPVWAVVAIAFELVLLNRLGCLVSIEAAWQGSAALVLVGALAEWSALGLCGLWTLAKWRQR